MLNDLIEAFKNESSEVCDDAANTLRERALAADSVAKFLDSKLAWQRRCNAVYVKSQLHTPEQWAYSRLYQILDANGHNLALVIRMCNGLQKSPVSNVNPLGYVLLSTGHIAKIMYVTGDTVYHTAGFTTYGKHASVNWFMPQEVQGHTVKVGRVMAVLGSLLADDVDPRNFSACLQSLSECVVSRNCIMLYVDHIYGAPGSFWRDAAEYLPRHTAVCAAMAMFADAGTPNPFDYPAATVKGMGL